VGEPAFTPFSIGRYRCEERLGSGGLGDLYLAVHLPSGGRRAIRSLSPAVLEDPGVAEQLLQTFLRVQKLTHPNILTIHELVRKESQLFVVMDYHAHITLRQVLAKLRETGPFSPQVASFVVWQISQALDHAHHLKEQGRPLPLVHGGLWPENVLLSLKGEVRLADFGTWVVPRSIYAESEDSIRRHFGYRSPEHLNGETLTRTSDLFCVGILLYEMLTARTLFLGATLMETVEKVEQSQIGALDGAPPALQNVLRRCLAPNPAARYADVAAFISELAVVVLGVGDRAVRQELVTFINAHFAAKERAPRPEPLPGLEVDEATNVSPTDLTEVLLALSREQTQPGRGSRKPVEATKELVSGSAPAARPASAPRPARPPGERPPALTPVSTRGMGRLAPQSISPPISSPVSDLGDEGPTMLSGPPDLVVEWEAVRPEGKTEQTEPALFPPDDERSVPTSERHAVLPSLTASRSLGPLQDVSTSETTTAGGGERSIAGARPALTAGGPDEDEPTVSARPQPLRPPLESLPSPSGPLPSDSVADELSTNRGQFRAIDSIAEEQPTFNVKLSPAVMAAAAGWASGLRDARPPPAPRRDVEPSHPAPQLRETASIPMLRDAASGGTPPLSPTRPVLPAPIPAALPEVARDEGLVFEGGNFAPANDSDANYSDGGYSEAGGLSGYSASFSGSIDDLDRPYSVSDVPGLGAKGRSFTAAHALLMVAILVFLVAVVLLVRRLVSQSAVHPTARQPDAAPRRADAAPPGARDQRTMARGDAARPTGKHLEDLLRGRLPAGQLRIESLPAGAAVYVNHRRVGVTPVDAKAKPGAKVRIAVAARGYKLHRELVALPADRGLRVAAGLKPAAYPRSKKGAPRGLLLVRCHKADRRRIFLGGEDTGYACPRVDFALSPGRYEVGVYSVERDKLRTQRVRIKKRKLLHFWVPRRWR
jgi:serine/threonine protein kinase